jgi:hypothetical protein
VADAACCVRRWRGRGVSGSGLCGLGRGAPRGQLCWQCVRSAAPHAANCRVASHTNCGGCVQTPPGCRRWCRATSWKCCPHPAQLTSAAASDEHHWLLL